MMWQRCLKIATCISTAMLAVSLLLLVLSRFLNPWDHHVSLNESTHVAVFKGFYHTKVNGRIVIFNNADYGPYRGNLIQMMGRDGIAYPILEIEEHFGDEWGVYYRYFKWQESQEVLWTLMVSVWYPILLFGILPTVRLFNWRKKRRRLNLLAAGEGSSHPG